MRAKFTKSNLLYIRVAGRLELILAVIRAGYTLDSSPVYHRNGVPLCAGFMLKNGETLHGAFLFILNYFELQYFKYSIYPY